LARLASNFIFQFEVAFPDYFQLQKNYSKCYANLEVLRRDNACRDWLLFWWRKLRHKLLFCNVFFVVSACFDMFSHRGVKLI
jgi:hypothetical protein